MIKRRPALVLSPRLPHRDNLCTVIPFSGTTPPRDFAYVVRIEFENPLPDPFPQAIWWAKCDMLATVGLNRLDFFKTQRDQSGKRKYIQPKISEDDFGRIRNGVLAAIGLVT